ncbi:MAG: hypothetical protein K0Q53_131 [Massilibacillus sp.]|jgi:hypothetical protein|nr:hypothetical protein [Massilibacillus sp.]
MKTQQTLELEKLIYSHTVKMGTFGCFEVSIGWFGNGGRVDYMTYDTKNVIRCYEIKVSKSDFHSKNGHNFVGDFNYYVMPIELYEQVKDEIPKEIGVYTKRRSEYGFDDFVCIKKPKRNKEVDKENLKSYMIRSLSRDVEKAINSQDVDLLTRQRTRISRLERDLTTEKSRHSEFRNKVYCKYGREAYRELA